MRSSGARARPTAGRSDVTSARRGFGACAPDAMKAARPPGLSTAKDFCATSPPTVSNTASQRHDLGEILRVVVDDLVGAEAAHVVEVGRAGGRDDARADMLGELDGEARNAAGAALDEDGLAALELERVLDRADAR